MCIFSNILLFWNGKPSKWRLLNNWYGCRRHQVVHNFLIESWNSQVLTRSRGKYDVDVRHGADYRFFISCFSVVYRRITVDYHSIIPLFQAVKLSFNVWIGYFRIFPEDRSFAICRSDWLTFLTENAESWVRTLRRQICDVKIWQFPALTS